MATNSKSIRSVTARPVVVSTRLPTLIGIDGQSRTPTASGLVSGLSPALLRSEGIWFGWGASGTRKADASTSITSVGRAQVAALHFSEDDPTFDYGAFANRTLWPLLHGFPDQMAVSEDAYGAYRRVNRLFANHLFPLLRPYDLVWVQDYQLIPVGAELRRLGWTGRTGFFLHTPFPSPAAFAALPWAQPLLREMLAYDLVGVQTTADASHVMGAVAAAWDQNAIQGSPLRRRQLSVKVHPVGIDVERFTALAANGQSPPPAGLSSSEGQHMLLGVDRLDYTKGIVGRLRAFERLLERHPSWQRRVTLVQIAAPSRTHLPEYIQERERVEKLVDAVNERFSRPGWTPVRYFYGTLPQEELAGLYRQARACLVTPLRDGMNLVAKEYIASQGQDPGVLVLSRLCGAAEQMGAALLVDPYDVDAMVDAFHRALEMPLPKRRFRQRKLLQAIQQVTAQDWAKGFLADLKNS